MRLTRLIGILRSLPPQLRRSVSTFSFLYFIYYFNFFWLIQNVYILNHGINFTQLSIILAIWSVCVLLLEVPSGILADSFGKKPIIFLAKFAFLIGILIFILMPNFLGFVLGVISFGIHESFISGAQESLLYDNLKDYRKENLFGKVLAFATTMREIGLGSGVLIAGFITQIGIKYNLIGSVIIAFLGLLTAMFLTEGKSHSRSEEVRYFRHFKESFTVIAGNFNLMRITLFSITVMTAYVVISEYFVPSLNKLGVSFTAIGFWAALEAMFFSLGSYLSQKLVFIKKKTLYFILAVLMGLFLLVISLATTPAVIIGFMILRSVKAISEIVTMDDWQNYVSDSQRATTISINSFLKNVVYIFVGLLFGRVADTFGLFKGFYLVAGLTLVYLLVLPLFRFSRLGEWKNLWGSIDI